MFLNRYQAIAEQQFLPRESGIDGSDGNRASSAPRAEMVSSFSMNFSLGVRRH